ncbi:MAG: hypothetical protein CMN77_06455 [Spirochaetaceae bacterium]|nr:hypothetical protein [Spirochaetaceae bacterium]|tara:strand:+ start:20422 stop:22509 length:2088 start_codon:yes stop_codon:yes gene_type:complete
MWGLRQKFLLLFVFLPFLVSTSTYSEPGPEEAKPVPAGSGLLLQKAFAAQAREDYPAAAGFYESYLKAREKEAESGSQKDLDFVRLQYGEVLYQLKRNDQAVAQIESALEEPTTETDLMSGLLLLADLGKQERSLELTLKALSRYPANVELNYHAAELYRVGGAEEKSMNYYTRVLHVSPPGDFRSGYYRSNSLWKLAVYYVGKKNTDLASLYALRFLEYHPESVGGRYLLGAGVFFENGKYNKSLPHLLKLDRLPRDQLKEAGVDTARLDFILGQIFMMRFDPRAIAYFSRCKDSNPLAEQYWLLLTNQPPGSYAPLLQFVKKHPEHLPARVALLYALKQQKAYDAYASELIAVSELAARLHEPDTGWKVIQRARAFQKERPEMNISEFHIHRLSWIHLQDSGHPHRALIEAERTIQIGDRDGQWDDGLPRVVAVENLARLYSHEEIGRNADAKRLLFEQLEKTPERHETHMVLGLVEWREHNWNEALKHMNRARELAPNRLDYLFLESVLLSEEGQMDRAEQGYLEVLKANSSFAPAQNSLGYLYARQGKKLEEARSLIEKAVQQEPSNAAYRDSLGWVYFKTGEYNLARFHLEMAATLMKNESSPSPEIYEHLGDVYDKLNMPLRALESYKEALRLNTGPARRPGTWEKEIQQKMRQLRGTNGFLQRNEAGCSGAGNLAECIQYEMRELISI